MLLTLVISIIILFASIAFHELGHAWMADKLGDPTPRSQGRLTLNPLAHIDIYGTIVVPLLLIVFGSPFVFGWAKPVQFDPYNLRNPKKDTALISFAGAGANLILAISASILLRVFGNPFNFLLTSILYSIIQLNVILALFNLIPIHPLDGGKILVGLLPPKDAYEADRFLNRYGFIILLILIFPIFGGQSPIFTALAPLIKFFMNILAPGNPSI